MKRILLLGTGGTIASEMTSSGLSPALASEQLLAYVPEISSFCKVDCLQLFSIDSTNMQPSHWLRLAEALRTHYDAYDGFVICHGTDTMAYTAAALSYLIQYSPKPIVLTGSQKPIGFDSSDSKANLLDSFRYAASDACGVTIVFNGRVILGTRARKTRSKSFKAFSSINYPDLAVLQNGYLMEYIRCECRERPIFYDKLDSRVAVLKLVPGVDAGLLSYMLAQYDAVIIESYGVGGLPTYAGAGFVEAVKAGIAAGKTVVMTTQVQNEGSELTVYSVGYNLKHYLNMLEAYDMTTEAAVAKIMWILGQTREKREIQRLFYAPVAHDIFVPKEQQP